jgi:hypothetical protein
MQKPGAFASDQGPAEGDPSSADSTGIVAMADRVLQAVMKASRAAGAGRPNSAASLPISHEAAVAGRLPGAEAIDVRLPSAAMLGRFRSLMHASKPSDARPLAAPKSERR